MASKSHYDYSFVYSVSGVTAPAGAPIVNTDIEIVDFLLNRAVRDIRAWLDEGNLLPVEAGDFKGKLGSEAPNMRPSPNLMEKVAFAIWFIDKQRSANVIYPPKVFSDVSIYDHRLL